MDKLGIRVAVLGCLAAAAVGMAAVTLADLSRLPRETGELLLGSWNGAVAVFDRGNLREPLEVTEIDLSTLREADRKLVEAGVPVADREALLTLLEDLGS